MSARFSYCNQSHRRGKLYPIAPLVGGLTVCCAMLLAGCQEKSYVRTHEPLKVIPARILPPGKVTFSQVLTGSGERDTLRFFYTLDSANNLYFQDSIEPSKVIMRTEIVTPAGIRTYHQVMVVRAERGQPTAWALVHEKIVGSGGRFTSDECKIELY